MKSLRELPAVVNRTLKPQGYPREAYRSLSSRFVEVTDTVFYPASGADIFFPMTVFPNATRYVLCDSQPFHDVLISPRAEPIADDFFDLTLANALSHSNQRNFVGLGAWSAGQDHEDPFYVLRHMDIYRPQTIAKSGLSHILLTRLRRACNYEINRVHQPIAGVYEINVTVIDSKAQKIIYYLYCDLTKKSIPSNQADPLNWLLAQRFNYQALFIKAFCPAFICDPKDAEPLSIAWNTILSIVKTQILSDSVQPFYCVTDSNRNLSCDPYPFLRDHVIEPPEIMTLGKNVPFGYHKNNSSVYIYNKRALRSFVARLFPRPPFYIASTPSIVSAPPPRSRAIETEPLLSDKPRTPYSLWCRYFRCCF